MNERIAERLKQREETITVHMDVIEQEIDDLLAEAPEALSEDGRKAIRDECLEYANRVLDALSSDELANLLRLDDFIVSLKAQATMRIHEWSGR